MLLLDVRALTSLVFSPKEFWAARFEEPEDSNGALLFLRLVAPAVAIGTLAVLLRSFFDGAPLSGFVLSGAHALLQVGVWWVVSIVLPVVARQFEVALSEAQSFCLVTHAALPFWLFGIFFWVGEDSVLLFFWSRLMVLAAGGYSLWLAHVGLKHVIGDGKKPLYVLGGLAFVGVSTYLLLFLCLGLGSHILLMVLR